MVSTMGMTGKIGNFLLTLAYLLAFSAVISPDLHVWDQNGSSLYTGGRVPLLAALV